MGRLLLALWLAASGTAGAAETPARMTLSGWIELTVPAGFTASENGRGVTIRQDGGLRTPLEIEILRGPIRTFTIPTGQRETSAGTVPWSITKHPAEGSGGAEWKLMVKHPAGWVIARQQRELGQPDFAPVWLVVDSIRALPAE